MNGRRGGGLEVLIEGLTTIINQDHFEKKKIKEREKEIVHLENT